MSDASKFDKDGRPSLSSELGRFPDRLKETIGENSLRKFAGACGLSEGVLRSYLRGDTYPTLDRLDAIATAGCVRAAWLITGEGAMRLGGATTEEIVPRSEERGQAGHLIDQDEFALVPRYDVRASCGGGAVVESEQIVDHLAFKLKWVKMHGLQADCLALISAKGDSMEPAIKDGYLLLVDMRQQEIKADAIYVLRIDHELVAKRCQKLFTGELKIKSDNPAYDEQIVPADKIDKLDVIGRVVWGGGKM